MTRRFWIGTLLTAPLVAGEMVGTGVWLQFMLATPVVLWAGGPFFVRAGSSVRTGSLNMFTLIGLSVGAAYLYSLAATLVPAVFPPSAREPGGTVPVYYESAAVITVLVLLGQVLELRAREQTSGAIRALLNLTPKTTHRITADGGAIGRPHEPD